MEERTEPDGRTKSSKLEVMKVMGGDVVGVAGKVAGGVYHACPKFRRTRKALRNAGIATGRALKDSGKGYLAQQLITTFNKAGIDIANRMVPPKEESVANIVGICVGMVQDMITVVGAGSSAYRYLLDIETESLSDKYVLITTTALFGAKVLTNLGSLGYQWYESAKRRVSQNIERAS